MEPVNLTISPILTLLVKKEATPMSGEPSGALFHQSCVIYLPYISMATIIDLRNTVEPP